jgi:hypothetical protein
MDAWFAGKKQAAIDSGEAPLGMLPVVYIGGKKYLEHVATARYIARRLGARVCARVQSHALGNLLGTSCARQSRGLLFAATAWVLPLSDAPLAPAAGMPFARLPPPSARSPTFPALTAKPLAQACTAPTPRPTTRPTPWATSTPHSATPGS